MTGILDFLKQTFAEWSEDRILLLGSLVLSTVLTAAGSYLGSLLPGADWLWQVLNVLLTCAVITLLFAMIFKFLPDAVIAWRHVWVGAAVAALLFEVGRFFDRALSRPQRGGLAHRHSPLGLRLGAPSSLRRRVHPGQAPRRGYPAKRERGCGGRGRLSWSVAYGVTPL